MSAPVRTINPSLTQYISVMLILICTFVLLSEQKNYAKKKEAEAHTTTKQPKAFIARLDPLTVKTVYQQTFDLTPFLNRENYDSATQEKFEVFTSMVMNHDLNLEFEISGRVEQLAEAVEQIKTFPIPQDAVRYVLKPGPTDAVSLIVRVVEPTSSHKVRVAA